VFASYGIPVVGVAEDLGHFCCRTRVYRDRAVGYHERRADRRARGLGFDLDQKAVLVPCTDLSVLVISRNRARLDAAYHVASRTTTSSQLLMDKARFSAYAQEHGLPMPRSVVLESRDDAEEAARTLRFLA
jgi:hypothetical protein